MKIGFIGTGNMGEALLAGFLSGGLVKPKDIMIYDADPHKTQEIVNKYEVTAADNNETMLDLLDTIILAIKPNIYPAVLPQISENIGEHHHLLSLAPGYNFAKINNLIDHTECKLSLIMSNTSARIGQGVTAACFGKNVSEDEKADLVDLFQSVGEFFEVAEAMMPTVTSVIGSVPALVYMAIEGIMQGAILEGLQIEHAQQIAAGVVASAANMIIQTNEHPAILRDRICSPGGTTIEGVAHLKSVGFEGKIIDAIRIMAEKARRM